MEGYEATEGEVGLVFRDLGGRLRFQREAELEKVDQEQLIELIKHVSLLPKTSRFRTSVVNESIARQIRFLPSTEKYELEKELAMVKEEEVWKDE